LRGGFPESSGLGPSPLNDPCGTRWPFMTTNPPPVRCSPSSRSPQLLPSAHPAVT
jgi:hypothetical protein